MLTGLMVAFSWKSIYAARSFYPLCYPYNKAYPYVGLCSYT